MQTIMLCHMTGSMVLRILLPLYGEDRERGDFPSAGHRL
jgi:hypothetical protein